MTSSKHPSGPDWTLAGEVGVDSGQLMVTDPCYIDSEWTIEEFSAPRPVFKLNAAGLARLGWSALQDWTWQCFREEGVNYATPLPELGNLSMNDLILQELVEEVPQPDENVTSYSYNGACHATTQEPNFGQLNYRMGHAGAGVVFGSGYGDGVYPVYVRKNDEGRIVEVRILME